MSPAQLQTLKAAILANTDPAFVQLRTAGATGAMADWYNTVATPVQKAWINNQQPQESDDAPDYSTFDSISQGKRESWDFFLRYPRDFNRNKVRKWVTDVWGAASANSNAAAILTAATRNAKRGELVFASVLRSTDSVSALDLSFVGDIRNEDIIEALSLS